MLCAAPILIANSCVLRVGGSVAAPRATRDSTANASLQTVVDQLFEPLIRDDLISGSVLIARKGKIVLAKGYGPANRERGLPDQPNTTLPVGVMTKLFTALIVMQDLTPVSGTGAAQGPSVASAKRGQTAREAPKPTPERIITDPSGRMHT